MATVRVKGWGSKTHCVDIDPRGVLMFPDHPGGINDVVKSAMLGGRCCGCVHLLRRYRDAMKNGVLHPRLPPVVRTHLLQCLALQNRRRSRKDVPNRRAGLLGMLADPEAQRTYALVLERLLNGMLQRHFGVPNSSCVRVFPFSTEFFVASVQEWRSGCQTAVQATVIRADWVESIYRTSLAIRGGLTLAVFPDEFGFDRFFRVVANSSSGRIESLSLRFCNY